ncbi:MAG TPA: hypothetical protein VFE77_02465 [Rhodanobacter sp.]|nr:hypothetical protein [Rhodanobacter sp.]
MKFENLVLRCLFLACLAVCGLVFGAMLTAVPSPGVQLAASSRVAAILLATPVTCTLPPDGVVCPRIAG